MHSDYERRLMAASDQIREDVLPGLGKAYDDHGPVSVLALAIMIADIWIESGFTREDWQTLVPSPPSTLVHWTRRPA
jgi:hypothetical protein